MMTKQSLAQGNIKVDIGNIPSDINLEQLVLGSIMEWNAMEQASSILKEECFYDSDNRDLFKIYRELYDSGKPVTIKRVHTFLKNNEKKYNLDIDYLVNITKNGCLHAELEDNCKILYEIYMKRELMKIGVELISNADKIDPFIFRDKAEEMIGAVSISGAESYDTKSLHSKALQLFDDIKKGIIIGIPTLIKEFDDHTGGLQRSDLIVIGGWSSHGKTTVGLNILTNAATLGYKGKIYSFEQSDVQIYLRQIGMLSGFDAKDITFGRYNTHPNVIKAMDELLTHKTIYTNKCNHINELIADIRFSFYKQKIDFVVIDYIQLIQTQYSDKTDAMSYVANRLKALANELNIPIVLMSQLRRVADSYKKGPTLQMLKESGDIENAADIVWMSWLPIRSPTGAKTIMIDGVEEPTVIDNNWLLINTIEKGRNCGVTEWKSLTDASLKIVSFTKNDSNVSYLQKMDFEQGEDTPF